MMNHEQTILHGVIIALVAATVTALTLAGLAVGRMRMAQDELDAVKADERTYREGYYATLARVEELEWQLPPRVGLMGTHYCLLCGAYLAGDHIRRCPVCGQRIDWEGEGE